MGSEDAHAGNRDKWEDLLMPEMPLSFIIWKNAMKRVDKDKSRVRGLVDPGYRVPEPALLISGQSPERRQRFMTNWLAIRPLWISRLDHDPPPRFPSPQQWREILHGVPSRDELEAAPTSSRGHGSAKGRKLSALEIFGEAASAMTQGSSSFALKEEVEWRGRYITIASLTNPPPRLIQAILWEVYEIGWRYELCALDQALNPHLWAEYCAERLSFIHTLFPGSSGIVLWSEALPTRAGDLGLTDSFPDNKRVLRSFCLFLSTWPNPHPSIASFPLTEPTRAQAYELASHACHFYVQTFFNHFGRPPLLPHQFPLEYHSLRDVVGAM